MSKDSFWDEMDDIHAAMLSIGSARHVPMSPYAKEKDQAIWFIGANGTDLVKALEAGESDASLIVTGTKELHARIEGKASLSTDRAKLEELWNPVASSWFDSIDDPDIRLIRVDPAEAEVWETKGSIGFAYQIAKAQITGETPDMGEHYTLTF